MKINFMRSISAALLLLVGFSLLAQTNAADTTKNKKKNEKNERIRKKHELWDSCFIVKSNGDTIYGKVNHRDDQSTVMSDYISDLLIFFAHKNGKEEQFIPNNLKELFVYNAPEGFQKYQVLPQEYYSSNYGILYRIAVDGPCKLISDRSKNNTPLPSASTTSLPSADLVYEETHYYLHYKKSITRIRIEMNKDYVGLPQMNVSLDFRKKCRKIFAECPALVEQIENKTFRSDNLTEIVREFNKCIGAKQD